MNNQPGNNNIHHNGDALKRDLSTLEGDSVARFGRFGENINQAREDLKIWVDDGFSQIGDLADDARSTVVDAAHTVKKDVKHGLNKYNLQAQAAADRVPGGFAKKAARYPWVALSIALAAGFILGRMLKPRASFHI